MDVTGRLQELAPKATARLVALTAIAGCGGVLVGGLMFRGNSAAIALGILVVLVGLAFPGGYWLWLVETRLLTGRGMVGYQDMFGRRRLWSPSEIARVVQLTIVYYAPRSGTQLRPAVLLVGADGRCLLKVRSANWADDAIGAFVVATGRTPEDLGAWTSGTAAREFPGSVGFMYAHTGWTTLITAGILVFIGALFLWWGLTR